MSIESAAVLSLITSASALGLSVARSKVTAVYLGPTGVGMAAEILQLVTLLTTPAGMITGAALVSSLAAARGKNDSAAANHVLRSAITAGAVATLVGGAL